MKWMQHSVVALLVAGTLSLGLVGSANAGDGLVSVEVNDNKILNHVNIALAAPVVANICNLSVSNVALLAAAVDQEDEDKFVCAAKGGDVWITQD
jgi:hypothetical protein